MTPEAVREWQGIFRDAVIIVVGAFMLIFEVFAATPNGLLVGAGVTLLGVPPLIRLDSRRRQKDDRGDPYDGPGGYFRE